jgi:hypothetical protein
MAKTIPNGFAFAVFVPGALDLIGRSSYTPIKALWKLQNL